MTQTFETVSLFPTTAILDKIQAAGFDVIRCNLTGQVIADMNHAVLTNAVNYLRFEQPLLTDSQIIDMMQMRWIVQCSRPAPHLTSFQSHDAHTYLVQNHPRDMFAILMGRMLFEHVKIDREMAASDAQKAKLFWLISLQESQVFQDFGPKMKAMLDTLIRLDSIHSIRSVFYSDKLRDLAAGVRDSEITENLLVAFIETVESAGFQAIAKRNNPPVGNRQSLNAALTQAGIMPWQLRIKENEAKQKSNAMAFAATVLENRAMSALERIKAGFADKETTVFAEIEDKVSPMLRDHFKGAIERAEKKQEPKNQQNKTNKTHKTSAAQMKAAARFGNLDFGL